MRKATRLLHQGDRFDTLYAVRTGSFKTVRRRQDGTESLTAFYLPGEVIGLSVIACGTHDDVIALEDSSVCEITYFSLVSRAARAPSLQETLVRALSREVARAQRLIVLLKTLTSEQRVAALLLDLAGRLGRGGNPAEQFMLPMSRHDIASYLGLRIETVSRVLSRLEHTGTIHVEHRHIHIIDPQQLRQRAGRDDHTHTSFRSPSSTSEERISV